jgi:hypothetical protein
MPGCGEASASVDLRMAIGPSVTAATVSHATQTLLPSPPTPIDIPSLTPEILSNATYTSAWVSGGSVTLVSGEYRERIGEASTGQGFIKMAGQYAIGDLDGDGAEDAAVLLLTKLGEGRTHATL